VSKVFEEVKAILESKENEEQNKKDRFGTGWTRAGVFGTAGGGLVGMTHGADKRREFDSMVQGNPALIEKLRNVISNHPRFDGGPEKAAELAGRTINVVSNSIVPASGIQGSAIGFIGGAGLYGAHKGGEKLSAYIKNRKKNKE
jgi:hypothetical protein